MLPGGSVENDVISEKILKKELSREIKEEIGIDITGKKLEYLEYLYYYQEDYPTVDGKIINRLVKTNYYKTRMDIDLNNVKSNLTDREKKGNISLIIFHDDGQI